MYTQPDPSAQTGLFGSTGRSRGQARPASAAIDPGKAATAGTPSRRYATLHTDDFWAKRRQGLRSNPSSGWSHYRRGPITVMDPVTDPLLTSSVENVSRDIRRVCVKAFIEGLSAQAIRTVEIEAARTVDAQFAADAISRAAREITEIQRATLHVIAEDLDGKLESHNTYRDHVPRPYRQLQRRAAAGHGKMVDLSHYYGDWVTPHVEIVQARDPPSRRAGSRPTDGRLSGRLRPGDGPGEGTCISRCVKPRLSTSTR